MRPLLPLLAAVLALASFAPTTGQAEPAPFVPECGYDTGKPCPGENAVRDAAARDEITVRKQIRAAAAKAVAARDFAELNAVTRNYRQSRSRTPSGIWRLDEYYSGIFFALGGTGKPKPCTYAAAPFIAAWIEADPSSPAPYIAEARMLSDHAWCLRGAGYADSVTDEGWRGYREQLAKARATLEQHRQIASVDPEFYVQLAGIYNDQGVDDAAYRALLDEATRREPYYYGLYFTAAKHYLPQWGGSFAEIDRLARYAAKQTAAEDGNGAYVRVYWWLIGCGCGGPELEIDRELLERSMADVVARYPNDWNTANFAMIACDLGDGRTAKGYLAKLPPRYGTAWHDPPQWRSCQQVVAAAS